MRLKRVISAALAVSMAVSMMPATAVSAFATDVGNSVAVQTAGNELTYNCGATENDHVTVSLVKNSDNETYTLVVSGTGSMADYSKAADVPWYGDNGQLMKKVTKGIVKSGITHLGARTFVLAENLTSVELPEGLLSIGVSCFNQTGLKSIQFPSTLQKIDDNAFWRGQIAGDVHIPESVTAIGKNVFNKCPITSVNLPEGLQVLGGGAFSETKLTEMPEIPESITVLDSTFQGCTDIKEITIPSQVTDISGAFAGTGISTVTIPYQVTNYYRAFNGCKSLEKVVIESQSDTIPSGGSAQGVFQNCVKLESVTLPEWVTTIGDYAFSGCTSLKDTAFLKDVKSIGDFAFQNAGLSGNLVLNATSIGYKAFINCVNLGPNVCFANVATIGANGNTTVFNDCTGLTGVKYIQQEQKTPNMSTLQTTAILNGGTLTNDTVYPDGELATPVKEGYTFAGWYDNAELTGKAVKTPEIGKTYYAKWACTVSFDTNGHGKQPESTVVDVDAAIDGDKLPVLKADGWVFDGWYTKSGMKYTDTDRKITANTTLYAKWHEYKSADLTVTVANSEYLVNEPVEVNVVAALGDDSSKVAKITLEYDDDVTSVKLGDITLGKKEFTSLEIYQLLQQVGSKDNAKLTVTYSKPGKHTFSVALVDKDGKNVCEAGTDITVVQALMDTTVTEDGEQKETYQANKPITVEMNVTADKETFKQNTLYLTYGDEVEKVELNGHKLTEKQYKISDLLDMMETSPVAAYALRSEADALSIPFEVTFKDAGSYDFEMLVKDAQDQLVCRSVVPITVEAEKKPDDTKPAVYTLSILGGTVKVNGKETAVDEHGDIAIAKDAKVEVTFDKGILSDAQTFDQWIIKPNSVLNAVDPKSETIIFTMPDEKVTIEAMTKDASIEDEPNILGTTAVVGTAAVGTAILAWQGYQLGTELYLKTALPAGTAIPTNRAELALLVWNHAGKPAPAAVLPADATDTQKAVAWAVENDLLKAAKDNGETYVDTDSVSRVEVIRVWNKAQEK